MFLSLIYSGNIYIYPITNYSLEATIMPRKTDDIKLTENLMKLLSTKGAIPSTKAAKEVGTTSAAKIINLAKTANASIRTACMLAGLPPDLEKAIEFKVKIPVVIRSSSGPDIITFEPLHLAFERVRTEEEMPTAITKLMKPEESGKKISVKLSRKLKRKTKDLKT